ncbi:MAG TPA: PfkB family carbohydrate kinase [Dehalococcoidia bacterium]|nr:PfkB family carbohydrate kinase [Dehalococcoidia bacterium]
MAAPDFLVVGHVVQDLTPDGGWRLGGAASYASLLAHKFGLRAAVLTSCAADLPLADLLPGIELRIVPGDATTLMLNEYDAEGRRTQHVPQRAGPLAASDLPGEWREARIVLLGPVAGEVDAAIAAEFSADTLVGAGAQGWLRKFTHDGSVRQVPPEKWDASTLLVRANALFLSDEDIPEAPFGARLAILDTWASLVDVVAFTRGYAGADIAYRGEWRRTEAIPANPTDLTGAGDVFAAAFLIHYAETSDPWASARLAAAASSLVIEGEGVEGVPDRTAVEARLAVA